VPRAYVEMHPLDAKELGVVDGENVRVVSRRGKLELPVKTGVKARARPPRGSLFVPFFDERYLVNILTLDMFCPLSKQPDYKKCAVRLERV